MRALVVGGGLIGRSVALALADRGAAVVIFDDPRPGAASAAAAGILAPSIEESGDLGELGVAARDLFPQFVERLRERTGIVVPLDRRGVLHVATSESHAVELRDGNVTLEWMNPSELAAMEPALAPLYGALFATKDGAVDNVALLAAVTRAAEIHGLIEIEPQRVLAVDGAAGRVTTANGTLEGDVVVLAAGAWVGTITGARHAVAVEPVRGQMTSFPTALITHVVYAPDVYLVPRPNGCTIAGSTMERVGFAPEVTDEALQTISAAARKLCPALGNAETAWAGLRPVTPDLMPLLGRDPAHRKLVYACGHSRNGVLLAPITAEIVAGIIFEARLNFDLSSFDPARFEATFPLK